MAKRPLSNKSKRNRLRFASFCFIVVPFLVVIAFNWNDYAPRETEASWTVPIGLVAAVAFIALIYTKKIQVKTPLTVLLVIFGLMTALKPIIGDLQLLSGVALGGAIIDWIFIQGKLRDINETITMSKEADIHAEAMVKAQSRYGSGRV